MSHSYLESALTSACPSFAREWAALRRTYGPDAPPSAEDFLGALRTHLRQLLAEGQTAETARVFYATERLLDDADPILEELLERELLGQLALDCRAMGVDAGRVLPHLGPRSRAAWARALIEG